MVRVNCDYCGADIEPGDGTTCATCGLSFCARCWETVVIYHGEGECDQ